MIKGVKLWNSRDCYYTQTNNPTEEMLRKRSNREWLVSCGPSAAVTCVAAMGYTVHCGCPGDYLPQSEEILMDFFHDPRNYEVLRRVRPDTPPEKWYGNEVPQFYPIAVHEVFGIHGVFQFGHDFNRVSEKLSAGKAVPLCLIKPGHYIAAVGYDEEWREIIYNDPWPERFPDKNGFNRRLTEGEFKTILKRTNQVDYKALNVQYQMGNLEARRFDAMRKVRVQDSKIMATDHDLWQGTWDKIKDQKIPP